MRSLIAVYEFRLRLDLKFDWLGSFWDYLDAALDYRIAAVIAVGARLNQSGTQLITTAVDVAYFAPCQPSDDQEKQRGQTYQDVG